MKRVTAWVLSVSLIAGVGGCGGGVGAVNGTVLVDGEPVANGAVTLVKTEGGMVREGAVIKGGVFQARVPPGKYKIEVTAQKVVGKRKQKGFDGKEEEVDLTEEMIPERYNARTELSEEIKPGSNSVKLDLKSKR
jgi:hypothetical protein